MHSALAGANFGNPSYWRACQINWNGASPVAGAAARSTGPNRVKQGRLLPASAVVRPAAVITVDALAARRLSRLGCTIQMSNTGITWLSVGNARTALNQETVSVPVIAIGVPTVVDAATLAIDLLGRKGREGRAGCGNCDGAARNGDDGNAREIDLLVERAARLVALSINCALPAHPLSGGSLVHYQLRMCINRVFSA